jgi:hypothetical protein
MAEERAGALERVLSLCQIAPLERAGERVVSDWGERGGSFGRRGYAGRNRDEGANHRRADREDRLHLRI